MNDQVICQTKDRITTITMNRPEKKNALTTAMYAAMADFLTAAGTDPDCRVIVITGSGDSFTAGNDLGDFLNKPPSEGDSPVSRFMAALATTEKPVIAAVNGVAVGIGTTMLLHCDFVYAAEDIKFSLPFVNLAVVPEYGSSYLFPRMLGHLRAAELLLLGEPFGPAAAREAGLVTAVVAADALKDVVRMTAQKLAAKAPQALRLTKALMKRHSDAITDQMAAEGAHFNERLTSDEAREAMTAFMEKRAPDFSRFS